MKKIGIITFHRAINYGALMQTYALQQVIKKEGGEVRVIDYHSPNIEYAYRLTWGLNKKRIKGWIKWFISIPYKLRKKRRFRQFADKKLRTTQSIYTRKNVGECEAHFDRIITGSDQVWNLKISDYDTAYLLDFVNEDKKKYSYSVSIGSYRFEDEYLPYIQNYAMYSLREKDACEYIEQITGKDGRVDIDPTLLLTGDDWAKEVKKTSLMNQPYIFIYSVHPQNNMIDYAYKLAEEKKCKIIYLHNRENTALLRTKNVKVIFDASPEEFLGYIKNAECVLTNSFHGTVFSILFHKKFFSELITAGGFNNRVFSLLNSLGLGRRILENQVQLGKEICIDEEIDWSNVEACLAKQRAESIEYVKQIVND